MSHLSNRLSLKSSSSRVENEKKLRTEGPDFLCIIRDFSLKEQYSAQESMNRFLQMEPTEKNEQLTNAYLKTTNVLNETEQRNEIRKNMINSFKSFKCVRLPEPVSDQTVKGLDREEALQQLDSIKYDDLRDKFRIKFDQMCEEIKENLKPKSINETNLNGFKLAEFMKIIVDLINNDETICLHDSLIGAIKREANYSFDSCKLLYENKMKEYAQKLPVKPSELEEKDEQIVKECLIKLHKIIGSNSIILEEFKHKFYEFRNLKYVEFYNENSKKQATFNKERAIGLWENNFKNKIETLKDLNDFNRLFNEFKTKFQQSDSKLKLVEPFWSEIESFIKSDKIKLDLVERKKLEEERRRADDERPRAKKHSVEEENKQFKSILQRGQNAVPLHTQPKPVKNDYSDSDCDDEQDNVVGTFSSKGSANGREVRRGPRGGLYYLTENGNKVFVKEENVNFY